MKLALAQPVYSAVPGPVARCVAQLAYDVAREGGEFWHEITWLCSSITAARFALAKWALSTSADRILMHDDDVQFTTEDVRALYAIDADVVGGCYVKREPGEDTVVGIGHPSGHCRGILREMLMVPLGMCLVRRHVLEDLISKHGEDLFAFAKGRDDSSTFCHHAVEAGYRLWLHEGVQLKHIGPYAYSLKQ